MLREEIEWGSEPEQRAPPSLFASYGQVYGPNVPSPTEIRKTQTPAKSEFIWKKKCVLEPSSLFVVESHGLLNTMTPVYVHLSTRD